MVIDTVSYEGDTGRPTPRARASVSRTRGATGDDNKGISRLPDGVDTDQNNVDLSTPLHHAGRAQHLAGGRLPRAAPALEIYEIQGAGLVEPVRGDVVNATDNVVTGVSAGRLLHPDPDARVDGDAETSDGVFVFTGVAPTVAVGDSVDVRGEVEEFFDFTEFGSSPLVTVDSGGNPLPAAWSSTSSPRRPISRSPTPRWSASRGCW